MDMWIIDKTTGLKRLKLCDEHYSKLVTEFWYSLRISIEADQIRGLHEDVMNELCMREWSRVTDSKIEAESKLDMKLRIRKSPDLGDWAAIILEGARRLGFVISKLGSNRETSDDDNFFAEESKAWDDAIEAGLIKH